MNKNKILNLILIVLIVFFTVSIVGRKFQNDTFFDIPIGKYVLENGIDMMDHFTEHLNLTYTYSHWAFGAIESLIYDVSGLLGIYILVLIISSTITVIMYILLNKMGNNKILSFIITIIATYLGQGAFTARAQIVTFLLFIIEFYCIEKLIKTNKNIYSVILLIIPIIIANFHASVWIIYFIFYLPYIFEFIVWIIIDKLKIVDKDCKLIVEGNSIKKLIITMILATFTGLLTPLGNVPYIFLQNNISGISKEYILELQPLNIIENSGVLFIFALYIGIITLRKTKVKITDLLYMLGFSLMSLAVIRSVFYLIFIGAFLIARIITNVSKEYDIKFFEEFEILLNKPKNILLFILCFSAISTHNILKKVSVQFVDVEQYPIQATEYILENIDIDSMRIYNSFNYGSYLELNGIKAFIDSRSEVYCEEFNDTQILSDVMKLEIGEISYKKIFEKYNITHVLIKKNNVINQYISEDRDYKQLYQDDIFILYEKLN